MATAHHRVTENTEVAQRKRKILSKMKTFESAEILVSHEETSASRSGRPEVSVFLPVYNEEPNLRAPTNASTW